MSIITERLDEALTFARECHAGQVRKGTRNPYLCHPMGVASLVLEFGGGEDEAIAGLLHDVLEDGGGELAGEIEAKFGVNVLTIVRECSDSAPIAGESKPPWELRKRAYVNSLPVKSPSALLVTACDKLHNLTAIVRDYREEGESLWDRFRADVNQTYWYYSEMTSQLSDLGVKPARELEIKCTEFRELLANRKPGG
jgi:(p)ppGpp synthase/HD superfamily hydrolase